MANRINERDLAKVIQDNAGLLGKPICETLKKEISLSSEEYQKLKELITIYVFSAGGTAKNRNTIIGIEEALREAFSQIGAPQFTTTNHPISCARDVFMTTRAMRDYIYCFTFYPLNSGEQDDTK